MPNRVECDFFQACFGVFAFFCKYSAMDMNEAGHDRKKHMEPSFTSCKLAEKTDCMNIKAIKSQRESKLKNNRTRACSTALRIIHYSNCFL